MPADITGTGHPRRYDHRQPQLVFSRTCFRLGAGRRNQPDPTKNASRFAGSHAGKTGFNRRKFAALPTFSSSRRKPVEQEGHLPAARSTIDRFLLKIAVGYPTAEEELAIVTATTGGNRPSRTCQCRTIAGAAVLVREHCWGRCSLCH